MIGAPCFLNRGQLVPILSRFSELEGVLRYQGAQPGTLDGALLDCGCSSMQFDNPYRGFGLSSNGPLDMRMDGERYVGVSYRQNDYACSPSSFPIENSKYTCAQIVVPES